LSGSCPYGFQTNMSSCAQSIKKHEAPVNGRDGVGQPHTLRRPGEASTVDKVAEIGLELWSMGTLPLSEVKARLSEIADEVDRTHERVHITRNGREYVVLISAEDLESLEATVELLSDAKAMARIRQAEADLAAGEVTTAEEMAALMEQRRRREQRGA
jgi:antitoxin YefM